MINVIHYPDTNSVEVTWADDAGKQTRCHSYADVQMDMLEADLGSDAAGHAALIATVRANIVPPAPPIPPTVAQQLAQLDADNALTQRNLRDFIRVATEALKLGQPVDLTVLPGVAKVYEVEAEAAALRAQL